MVMTKTFGQIADFYMKDKPEDFERLWSYLSESQKVEYLKNWVLGGDDSAIFDETASSMDDLVYFNLEGWEYAGTSY